MHLEAKRRSQFSFLLSRKKNKISCWLLSPHCILIFAGRCVKNTELSLSIQANRQTKKWQKCIPQHIIKERNITGETCSKLSPSYTIIQFHGRSSSSQLTKKMHYIGTHLKKHCACMQGEIEFLVMIKGLVYVTTPYLYETSHVRIYHSGDQTTTASSSPQYSQHRGSFKVKEAYY